MSNEEELMKRCREGNHQAFSELVDPHLHSAYRTAYVILKSKEHAEDAVQNTLITAYNTIMKGVPIKNFKSFFHTCVTSRSIDILRKIIGDKFSLQKIESSIDFQLSSDTLLDNVENKERSEQLLGLILSLKPEQRIPILLHYYQELTIREIAQLLKEKENTIKTRLSRGRKNLSILMDTNWRVYRNEA